MPIKFDRTKKFSITGIYANAPNNVNIYEIRQGRFTHYELRSEGPFVGLMFETREAAELAVPGYIADRNLGKYNL